MSLTHLNRFLLIYRIFGFPISVDPKTNLFITTKSSLAYSLLIFVLLTVSYPVVGVYLRYNNTHTSNPSFSFYKSVRWFHVKLNYYLTILLLLLVILKRKQIVKLFNDQRILYNRFATIYETVRVPSYFKVYQRHFFVLSTILGIKVGVFGATFCELFFDGEEPSTNGQYSFPMLITTLVNGLFLLAVSFLIIFIKKLHNVIANAVKRKENVTTQCRLSDLMDEMAGDYQLIYQHKCDFNEMVACSVLLLSVQRFIDVIIRIFYLYRIIEAYYMDTESFHYVTFVCTVMDLLVVVLEFALTSQRCEQLIEEVCQVI